MYRADKRRSGEVAVGAGEASCVEVKTKREAVEKGMLDLTEANNMAFEYGLRGERGARCSDSHLLRGSDCMPQQYPYLVAIARIEIERMMQAFGHAQGVGCQKNPPSLMQ